MKSENRINVSPKTITYKTLFGTNTINRDRIKDQLHITGFVKVVRGVMRILLVVTLIEGIKLLSNYAMVEITVYGEKRPYRIWFKTQSDYDEFCHSL